jgi:YHS domain-containing protein
MCLIRIQLSVMVLALWTNSAISGQTPDEPKPDRTGSDSRRAAQRALEPLNDWVGSWRGVGQPRRGSSKGAWTEQADWAWKIDAHSAHLAVDIPDGKLFRTGLLRFDPDQKLFQYRAELPDGTARTYTADRFERGKLVLLSNEDQTGTQHRLSFHMIHADRLLLLIEYKAAGQPNFTRQAEIGYTRKGGSFANVKDSYPKCIVTGGRGTSTVEYKGKTYYVCCSGCKQAFLDDPDAVLAEALERLKQEAAEAERKQK